MLVEWNYDRQFNKNKEMKWEKNQQYEVYHYIIKNLKKKKTEPKFTPSVRQWQFGLTGWSFVSVCCAYTQIGRLSSTSAIFLSFTCLNKHSIFMLSDAFHQIYKKFKLRKRAFKPATKIYRRSIQFGWMIFWYLKINV